MRTIIQKTLKEKLFPDQLGDYELISLFIETPRDINNTGQKFKQYGLSLIYSNLSIYEDIYSNCLTGSVTLVDANHLINDFPIIGEETVEICFRSLNTNISILLRMRVTGISEIINMNENTYVYTLYLTSSVGLLSEKQKISKSFWKGNLSQVIEYICINYLNLIDDKKVPHQPQYGGDYLIKDKSKYENYYSIETTSGHTEKYVAPYYSPFRIINKLCRRSISETGSLFFFFQDINKFRLVSLEDIFKKRENDTKIRKVVYVPKDTIEKTNLTAWNVVNDYKILSKFDILKNMSRGMYSSEFTFVDIEKKDVKVKQYYYQRDAKKQYHVNPQQYLLTTNNSDITHNELREDPRTVKEVVMVHKGDQESQDYSDHYSEMLQRRQSIQSQLDSLVLQIEVPGDSSGNITIGDLIEFSMPKYERQGGDEYLTGRYLVTRIHHSIDIAAKYKLIIEMVSDTLSNGYNLIEREDSTKTAMKIDSKDITLELDRDVVGTSVTSLIAVDDYYQESRKRRIASYFRN